MEATASSAWTFDEFTSFDDGSERVVNQKQAEKLDEFVSDYASKLHTLEETLDETLIEVWDASRDPIALDLQPFEQSSVVQLVRTDNKLFNKVVLVFSSLCTEIQQLKEAAVSKFYAPLTLFGETPPPDPSAPAQDPSDDGEGEAQLQFGRLIPLLQDLVGFVQRCQAIVKNIVQQLAALYEPSQRLYRTTFERVHLQTVFDQLAELCTVLLTLDALLASNPHLNHAMQRYQRMLRDMRRDPAKYQTTAEQLYGVERLLFMLKEHVLDARIFLNTIEQDFEFPGVINVAANSTLRNEWMSSVRTVFSALVAQVGRDLESNQRYRLMGLLAVYVFYLSLFKEVSDPKFFKQVWALHRRVPVVHLYGDVVWFPCDFLQQTAQMMLPALTPQEVSGVAQFNVQYMQQLARELHLKVANLELQSGIWMVRMESALGNRADPLSILSTRSVLVQQGLALAYNAGTQFKECVHLHLALQKPLPTHCVPHLGRLLALLKGLAATMHRTSARLGHAVPYMVQQISAQLANCVRPIRARLEQATKFSDGHLDLLAASQLAMDMIGGPATKPRRLILKICVSILLQLDFLAPAEVEALTRWIQRLDQVADVQQSLQMAADCAFVYWTRALLPGYLAHVASHPSQAPQLPYVLSALDDCGPLLDQVVHQSPALLRQALQRELDALIQTKIVDVVARAVEVDLRLHIHSHLAVADRNPFRGPGLRDPTPFLSLGPLRLLETTLDIRARVAHYLDTVFYNLCTVSLNDWKTYTEMRTLAREKYRLEMTEVHLPSQTLEQGIDVLQIMRHIHVFVARYHYSLNSQLFVEKHLDTEAAAGTKTLNCVTLTHVANSIRTHGVGMLNTAVNFVYQFLKQKFVIFSQFLFDDHIKSRLYKDVKFFNANYKTTLNYKYPRERAEKFNREIRKLGLVDNKLTYLDQFRSLVTEIGNAMGYIRMLRSGGHRQVATAIQFVPDLQDIPNFKEAAAKENLSPESVAACDNLDQAIEALHKNFAEGSEYFSILVEVFAERFRSEENAHLRNFYAILPPLTVNFVEYALHGKDKLSKRKPGGFFCDDGFALGIAYCLKLLGQNHQFDSLHWFEEVFGTLSEEQKKAQQQLAAAGKSATKAEDTQAALLLQSKLAATRAEYDALRFAFDSSRLFFRSAPS